MTRPLRADAATGRICAECGHAEGAHVGVDQSCLVSLGRSGNRYIVCPCQAFEPLVLSE